MERKRQRELALASVAIVLLAVAAFWNRAALSGSARRLPNASASSTAPVASSAQNGHSKPLSGVNLDALGGERPQPEDSVRNPFRFDTPPPAAPPPPSIVRQPQTQGPGAGLPVGPAQPPPPPRIALKYIGDMADPHKPGGKIAILSDSRGVYYGREGEIIEGRYRIVKIGVESVDLAYLDGRGRQTIRQNGQ
jgi:hypothetical protein